MFVKRWLCLKENKVPATCSAEATGMPERKRDARVKPTGHAVKARQDVLSLRCFIPFKMITSLPADKNRRYYTILPKLCVEVSDIRRLPPRPDTSRHVLYTQLGGKNYAAVERKDHRQATSSGAI